MGAKIANRQSLYNYSHKIHHRCRIFNLIENNAVNVFNQPRDRKKPSRAISIIIKAMPYFLDS